MSRGIFPVQRRVVINDTERSRATAKTAAKGKATAGPPSSAGSGSHAHPGPARHDSQCRANDDVVKRHELEAKRWCSEYRKALVLYIWSLPLSGLMESNPPPSARCRSPACAAGRVAKQVLCGHTTPHGREMTWIMRAERQKKKQTQSI